jgi:hypothetical protein
MGKRSRWAAGRAGPKRCEWVSGVRRRRPFASTDAPPSFDRPTTAPRRFTRVRNRAGDGVSHVWNRFLGALIHPLIIIRVRVIASWARCGRFQRRRDFYSPCMKGRTLEARSWMICAAACQGESLRDWRLPLAPSPRLAGANHDGAGSRSIGPKGEPESSRKSIVKRIGRRLLDASGRGILPPPPRQDEDELASANSRRCRQANTRK